MLRCARRFATGFTAALLLVAQPHRADAEAIRDIEYARAGDISLQLDLHLPPSGVAVKKPLVVWIHGGAWRAGKKDDMPLGKLVEQGYAVASIGYRLSTVAQFPAQAHDIKAAIRFLRAHAADWKLDASRIVIAGGSAGGHLAALVGVSAGVKELEGTLGSDLSQSTDVQGIISQSGASNLQDILDQSTPFGLTVRVPALQLLLGGQPKEKPELARLASPVAHLDPSDPPLLLIHGDEDPQMPFQQAVEFQHAYEAAKLPVQFEPIHGGKHGGKEFYDETRLALITRFLESVAAK